MIIYPTLSQQQQLNQQLLSQLNLGDIGTDAVADQLQQTQDILSPQTSLVTIFVSGKNPGEFSKVVSTVTLGIGGDDEDTGDRRRFKRSDEELLKLMLQPTKVQPVVKTREPPQPFAQDIYSAFDL